MITVSRVTLASSPLLYPIAIERTAEAVQFLRMTEEAYVAASFLDARMLGPNPAIQVGRWGEVREATSALPEHCHFIFHISHAGSTLLSRLVGYHESLFSLREPAILRNLAEVFLWLEEPACDWTVSKFEDRLSGFLRLWSRTFRPQQTAVIKATSFASDMAAYLLRRVSGARAILMYVSAEVFLRALLHGTRKDIQSLADNRWRRLHRYLDIAPTCCLNELSPGECVAMSWLAEMLALDQAAAYASQSLWIDFDEFLKLPQSGLQACLQHLGADCSNDFAEAICSSSVMTQYSKAPQHGYDPELRSRLLAESSARHGDEIRKGLTWLESFAKRCDRVQRVFSPARA